MNIFAHKISVHTKSNHIKCDVINIIERHRFISGAFQLNISKIMPVKNTGMWCKDHYSQKQSKILKKPKILDIY